MKKGAKLSKRYQRGLWVLVVLIALITLTPRFLNFLLPSDEWTVSQSELKEEVATMDKTIRYSQKQWSNKKSKYKAPHAKFDPNTYSTNDWMKLGLSQKQSDIIVKFSKRGIYSNDDLQQIFVLPAQVFELIKDSTFFPERKSEFAKYEKTEYPEKKKNDSKIVELNTASEQELVDLNGIGPYFAKKILEYRSKLGGFHSKSQLLEVWKLDNEKLDQFDKQISINQDDIIKINIKFFFTDIDYGYGFFFYGNEKRGGGFFFCDTGTHKRNF